MGRRSQVAGSAADTPPPQQPQRPCISDASPALPREVLPPPTYGSDSDQDVARPSVQAGEIDPTAGERVDTTADEQVEPPTDITADEHMETAADIPAEEQVEPPVGDHTEQRDFDFDAPAADPVVPPQQEPFVPADRGRVVADTGAPLISDVLTCYAGHRARGVWMGEVDN